jgi:hypothetical protein
MFGFAHKEIFSGRGPWGKRYVGRLISFIENGQKNRPDDGGSKHL